MTKGISINGNRKHISFYNFDHDNVFVIDYKYILKEVIYETYYTVGAVGSEYEIITGKEIIVEGCKETPIREIEIIKYMDILGSDGNWNWNLSLKVLNELKLYNTLKDQTKMVSLVDIMLLMNSRTEEQQFRKVFNCKFNDMYLVFEKYGDDLGYILSRKEPPLSLEMNNIQQQWLLSELLLAVSCLHSQKLIHRDLRPSNVCVNFEEKILKLKSFGLSCGFLSKVYLDEDEEEEVTDDDEITPVYTPPEIILGLGGDSSPSVDVWGVGCIFAEILSGGSPLFFLPSRTKPTTPNKIGAIVATLQQNKGSSLDKLSPSNPLAIDLLRRMLDFNPDTRISLEEAKRHAYFGGGSSSSSSSRGVALAEEDMGVVEVTVPEVVEPDAHSLRKLIWKEMETFEMNKKKKTLEMNKKRTFEMNKKEIFEMNKKTCEIPLES